MIDRTQPKKRRLPPTGPLLLWRDGADGAWEGLMLMTYACENVECTCREVHVMGALVSEHLLRSLPEDGPLPPGDESKMTPVLWANVDIDTGVVTAEEEAPESKAWALEWLRGELDAELLGLLRERFAAAKAPRDWRTEDWSWWKPGMDVAWIDVHPGKPQVELELDGQVYLVEDLYCVDPDCDCEDVRVGVFKELKGSETEHVGDVFFDPQTSAALEFQTHGSTEKELRSVWAAYSEGDELAATLASRRKEMRGLAREIHSLFGAPRTVRRAAAKVGRNDPCPCGSGLKYKKCCMEKA